ncbi:MULTISPECIES: hypothetical protein [Sedimentibacter]|uniref:Uncharacterized protein n=1 Tax=Sedimentibacter hydroxybenzoicus DSM 7310 TaxID=1123245 RepID=A0A974BJV1_SEDHY|nr:MULTISPECIES: hypothetical protein [Sedimentibacter]NYB74427.1 hypothetical protein [Sedimentibacter hydroxybenzoicus DSM 7310]
MSDEVRATNFDCCDRGCDNNWIEWIIIIFVIFWLLGGNNWLGGIGGRGGCCR